MNNHPIRTFPIFGTLLVTSLLAFPALSFASRSSQARANFDAAVRLRTTLEAQPENARSRADYETVIAAFRSVYRADPASSKAPVALDAVAQLYEEMGRRFSDERSFRASIGAYQFLAKEYPRNTLSHQALLGMAEVYRTDLNDLAAAQTTLREYLKRFPKSEKAAQAQATLKEIQQTLAGGATTQGAPPDSLEGPRVEEQKRRPGQTLEVTSVRRWVGPNYTRIVIGVDGEVAFDTIRLASPDRLVFDLSDARPSPELMGKTFPVEDGFLRQIRVALFKPTVTRVVLDVEHIEDYSVFPLPNPFRLVIDIHGSAKELTGKNNPAKPAPTEGAASSVAENAPAASQSARTSQTGSTTEGSTGATTTSAAAREPAEPQRAIEEAAGPDSRSKASKQRAALSTAETPVIKTPAPTQSGSRTLTRALGLKIGRIVIDPGHGGHDTGTVGPTGLTEKDLVLDVGLRLAKLVERNGSEVVMTRSDDTFVPLEERTAVANEKAADLFISIHANASRDHSARGIETYYLNFTSNSDALEVAARENATSQESVHELRDLIKKIALTEKIEESHEFATQVQHEVHDRLAKAGARQKDRGVKKAPFVVLIGANMPSVLAEISFLTNPKDERLLKQPEYRQKIAEALYQGIARYVNNLGGMKVAQETRPAGRTPAGESQAPLQSSARQLSRPDGPDF